MNSLDHSKNPDGALDDGSETLDALLRPLDGLSHVKGETVRPLIERTIPELLAETVRRFADRDALIAIGQNIRLNWREFSEEVDALARGLALLGLKKGDRLGIWSPNRAEWVLTQFATARIGIILVNINPAYRLSELDYALNKVGCAALVTAASFKTSNYLEMLEKLAPELRDCEPGKLRSERLPHLKTVIRMGPETTPGMLNFDAVLERGRSDGSVHLDRITKTLDRNDAINIQFTSGTTGAPKGATLTHRNLVNNGDNVTARMLFTEKDRLCIPVPLYHCFGMSMGTLGCVTKGAAMVFPGEGFEPSATLKAIESERCTSVYGVPTMFVAMLNAPDFADYDLTSLRTGIMAGAPCPTEVMKRVIERMHMAQVTIAYGMTETSPVSFQSHTNDPLDKRVSTVGRIHPHVEIKIVEPGGETVPVGETGELCTRGYCVMQGYWDDPENTAAAITGDGWMQTGDLATIDEDGYAAIVGRVKDMVIRGGENIYPREVEEFLYRHPAIADVQVFGIPDEKYGEELCAWIIVREGQSLTPEEVVAFCTDQISHFKVPRIIRFRESLPMTVTGKPQKFLMREAMVEELGLGQ
ncbi:MAG TPA: AMP-binding protein [Pararhizobium sp.]|nr:AMP-binding protein [Pararhizobium sp.]